MSLINRVLNKLEQRGVHSMPNQTLIRAVPERVERNWLKPVLLVFAATVVAGMLWLGLQLRQPPVEVVKVAAMPVPASAVASAASSVASEVPEAEPLQPASKLSFELSAVPAEPEPEPPHENKKAKPLLNRSPVVAQVPKPVTPERQLVESKAPVVSVPAASDMPVKLVSRTQQADAEYRKALLLQQQGHAAEALAGYETALKLNALQDAARLAMAALLVESKRSADAERTLQEGLQLKPAHIGFSMALARVQVENGKIDQALQTLQRNLPQAEDKADYQAFYAALLQRQDRHKEAVDHYQIAVQLAPNNGVWLMGYGLSLQAVQRIDDAKSAYMQALATRTLSPELTAFVQQKLKGF